MSKRLLPVAVYSLSHFLVDFASALLLMGGVAGSPAGYLAFLLYNFCAFALELPFGIIADRLGHGKLLASAGCLLVALAFWLTGWPMLAALVAGVGNGLFHVGCGIEVLGLSEGKGGLLGVFVSPGALGVFLGSRLGAVGMTSALAGGAALALALAAACISLVGRGSGASRPGGRRAAGVASATPAPDPPAVAQPAVARPAGARPATLAAAGLLAVVVLRSFVGLTLQFPFRTVGGWAYALVTAVVLGKAMGGFVADRLGARRASALSLGLAALLFCLPDWPLVGVIALLLFNMTMPITLWALSRLFPADPGLSFGLTTYALFLGYLPVGLGLALPIGLGWLFPLLALLSGGLLWLSLKAVG